MKNFSLLVFILILFSSKILFSEIIEIKSVQEALTYLDEETLVVFDGEDTLIAPKQMLGTSQWLKEMYQKLISEGYSQDQALDKLLPLNTKVQNASSIEKIEEVTPFVIYQLQKKGCPVIALSARSHDLANKTIEQLASFDIHLGRHFSKIENFEFDMPIYFKEGVLFASYEDKAHALISLMQQLNTQVKHICVIDNELEELQQIEKVCEQNRMPFIGFRYTASDEKKHHFDLNIANMQLKYLGEILSNEDADRILQKQKSEEL